MPMVFVPNDIFIIVASLQLILLVIALLRQGAKRLANQLLAAFFFAQTIVSLYIVWQNNHQFLTDNYPYMAYLAGPLRYVWGPFMYFFVKANLNNKFKLIPVHTVHFIPAIGYAIYILFAFHIKSFEEKQFILNQGGVFSTNVRQLINISIIAQVLIYNISAIIYLRNFRKKKNDFDVNKRTVISTTQFILYGYFIVCISYDILIVLNLLVENLMEKKSFNYLSMYMFSTYFLVVLYKLMAGQGNILTGKLYKKGRQLTISQHQLQYISEVLDDFMETKKPYLEFNYTITELADDLSIKPRELSQTINEIKKQNFYDYFNYYRIKTAEQLLKNSIESKKTILEIAYESGFNSKTAFNVAFKKQTGLTPTQFKSKLK